MKTDSGYRPCACRDCMEIAIGESGALCHHCEDAGCDPNRECQAVTAYGDEPEECEDNDCTGCAWCDAEPERRDYKAPERLACITAGEHMVDRDGTGFCVACGYFDPPLTTIHAACERDGFYVVTDGTDHPVDVIAAMVRALVTLDVEQRMTSTIKGPESAIPEEALADEAHPFWASAEARLVLDALTIALNALAPEGFAFTCEGSLTRLGFFR